MKVIGVCVTKWWSSGEGKKLVRKSFLGAGRRPIKAKRQRYWPPWIRIEGWQPVLMVTAGYCCFVTAVTLCSLKASSLANVHARDSDGWDALMWDSDRGHIAACTVLLNRGADPDSNNQHVSALSFAALYYVSRCACC